MQIILLEKIGGLGNLGDIVTVKNGYARNFLIPSGKAKRATDANKAEFEARRAELEARQAEILADAQARQAKLDGQTITVAQKAGVDGRLFGSVTNADIAEAIRAAGIEAAKSEVRLPEGPFKAVGEYEVEVALHTDAVAKITVAVVPAAAE
ncbi:50S ribosomal protein L9 [Neisseria leonii]|uniref:Large ribosomal subunit protein bL9 n=1 Tax=Neisseria leonii TaxID=2995413 RepID=A0A9X4ID68_9NEIS|nr:MULTISPECIES: 50S ribosomal protein L9 [unclassified Neisseria]MDD9325593.1 50S ribosomal protein L9 [Neisseria sp. 3986]MDD9326818.1 50S ribosomal protein L9 [Neisseria sp. 51.81]